MGTTEDWLASLRDKNAAQIGTALSFDTRSPDEAAQAELTGKELGIAPSVVSASPAVFKRQAEQKRSSGLLKDAPMTSQWLRDRQNGTLAKDDLDNLTWFERGLRDYGRSSEATSFGRAVARGTRNMRAIPSQMEAFRSQQLLADAGRSFEDLLAEEVELSGGQAVFDALPAATRTMKLEGLQRRFEAAQGVDRGELLQQGAEAMAEARRLLDSAAGIQMSGGATRFRDEVLAEADNSIAGALGAFARDPLGGAAFVAEVAAEFLPAIGVAAGVGMVTRSPLAGALALGGGSALTENTTSAMEFLSERGVDVSTPEAAAAALEDAELMRAAREQGLTRGMVIGIMDGLSGGLAGQQLMASPVGDVIVQGLAQTLFGGGGEALAQVATGQEIDWRDVVVEGLADLVTAPAEAFAVGRRALSRQPSDAADTLTQVDEMAAASKLKLRAPDKFAEALEAMGLGEVYVPADKLREFFQAKDISEGDWGFDADIFNEQVMSGQNVAIPLATYASRISGTDAAEWVKANAVADPDELSAAEAQAFNEEVQSILEQARRDVADAEATERELRAADQQIYDDVFFQLRESGRSPDVARNEALVHSAFWRTMAERFGEDALELARSMGLRIQGPVSPEAQRRRGDLDIRLNTLRKGMPKPTGQSLVDFVKAQGGLRDTGGDVAAMNPPKGLIGETAEQGRERASQPSMMPGEAKGVPIDIMARMAVEEGYFPGADAADADGLLLEAIREELAGRPTYLPGEGVDPDLEALQAELAQRGIDLAASNDEIAAALDATDGREYDQSGTLNTDTEAFRAWFGDSKVVDENGKPLVVYHGTRQDISREDFAFKPELIGSATDGGHYGRGFYFTPNKGEAEYYGENIAAVYLSMQNPLDLSNTTGDFTFIGHFKSFGPKLDAIGALGEDQKRALTATLAADAYVVDNVKFMRAVAQDGTEGWTAKVPNPAEGYTDEIHMRPMMRGAWPETKEEALQRLQSEFRSEMERFHREVFPGLGEEAASLSDYVRMDLGPEALTAAAEAAGYDGIIYGDEYVAFRPEQIKSVHNRGTFDPADPRILYQDEIDLEELLAFSEKQIAEMREKADARKGSLSAYPAAIPPEYEFSNYEAIGGRIALMSPDEFLSLSSELAMDEEVRENVDDLAAMMLDGRKIDPPQLMVDASGKVDRHDGRHRALAAKALGIEKMPVLLLGERATAFPEGVQSLKPQLGAASPDVAVGVTFYQRRGAKRGSIVLPAGGVRSGETVINLFEQADLSTFLHESGHYFLEAFNALASDETAPAQMREDMAAIREWLGNDGGAFTTEQHEKWARASEAYFMEGKAPSLALADAFSRFKAWLTRIYRSIAGLNVKVTPEIKDVMDRMLATDAEIAEARAEAAMSPLFKDAPAGMSKTDYQTYQRMARRATEQAEQSLLEKTMAKVRRDREAWYKAEKKAVRAEVEASINKMPVYRLTEALANGRWFGSDEELPDMRMDRAALVDMFSEGVLKEIDRSRIGGKRAIYKDGGDSPQDVARFFGFANAIEMMEALQNAGKRVEAINAEVERVMTERHGDPLNDGSIEAEALEAIHNDQQANTVAAEVRHLAGQLGRKTGNINARVYRQRAKAMLGRMSVKDAAKSHNFLAAERRAARTAEKAFAKIARGQGEGALAEAYQAKEQQLLNQMLYAESREFERVLQRGREKMRDYSKKSVREKLDGGYIEQIDALLERFDFRVRSEKQVQNAETLRAYMDRMIADGREAELAIDERFVNESRRVHYSRLSVDELHGLFDTIANLDHMGRRRQTLIEATRKRKLNETASRVAGQINANISGTPPGRVATTGESLKKDLRDYLNTTLNADTLLREYDGFKDLGPAWAEIKQPIDEGMARLEVRRQEARKAWDKIYGEYSSAERREMTKRRHIPELNTALSKWDLISIALNTGNETNFERLTNPKTPGHFKQAALEAALGTHLSEKNWKTVQEIWDFIGSYWPEIEAKTKRQSGTTPKKVVSKSMIAAAPGFLRGGYFPIDYDGRLSGLAADLQKKDLAESLMSGRFGKAQTADGHTKARVKSTNQPLRIDIGIGHRHVDEVLYDLELGEAVRSAWRILQHSDVRSALVEKGRQSDFDALEMWLKDTAEGDGSVARGFEKVLRRIRSGFTISRLALNIGTILLQPSGISQSFVVVGKKAMARGITSFMANPVRWREDILAASPLMQQRWKTLERDVHTQLGELQTGPMYGYQQFKNKVLMPAYYAGMMKVQFYSVDMPTWVGAYLKELDASGSETKARSYADLMVRRAQGSGLVSDLGMLQRGSTWGGRRQEMPKLFTALGSYMFAKFNVAYEQAVKTDYKNPAEVLSLVADVMLLFTLEAALYSLLRGGLPDDEEDESLAAWMAKETALSAMSTVPGLRELASVVEGFNGGGAFGSSMDIGGRLIHQLSQGEMDKGLVKAVSDVAGIAFGLPSSQTNRVIDALLDEDMAARSDPDPLKALGIGGGKERSLADILFGND